MSSKKHMVIVQKDQIDDLKLTKDMIKCKYMRIKKGTDFLQPCQAPWIRTCKTYSKHIAWNTYKSRWYRSKEQIQTNEDITINTILSPKEHQDVK